MRIRLLWESLREGYRIKEAGSMAVKSILRLRHLFRSEGLVLRPGASFALLGPSTQPLSGEFCFQRSRGHCDAQTVSAFRGDDVVCILCGVIPGCSIAAIHPANRIRRDAIDVLIKGKRRVERPPS